MNKCRMISVALLLCCLSVTAKEGFWQIKQQPELAKLLVANKVSDKAKNLDRLTRLSLNTTVQVGDCSGALVSNQGLVLTNYDCIASKINENSHLLTAENFVATSSDTELVLDDLQLKIPQQVEDVTLIINRQLDVELSAQQRQQKIQQISEQLINQCEQQSGLSCQLHSVSGGLKYSLVKSIEIQDVRLVYAPNNSLARLDPSAKDNAWPQYNADYVFVRGYVDTKGQAAAFSLQNVPYQAATFLTIASKGVAQHEHILVAGFPQQSQRYQTAEAVKVQFEQLSPLQLHYQQQALAILQQQTKDAPQLAKKYQQQLQLLESNIAQEQAKIARFQHSIVVINKLAQEEKLNTWINGSSVRRQLYTQIIQQVAVLNQQQYQQSVRDLTLKNLNFVQLPTLARQLYQYALLRQTESSNSKVLALTKKALLRSMQQFREHFDSRVDQNLALHFLAEYAQLPAEYRLAGLDYYFSLNDGFNLEIVRHKLAAIYRGTKLMDPEQQQAWLTASVSQFQQSEDSLISFAVAMQPSSEQASQQRLQLEAKFAQIWPDYIEIWQAFNDANNQDFYADANGTLRLNIAKVEGYQPKDAIWYQPFSSAQGLIDSLANIEQSSAVQKVLQRLKQTKQQKLPINFLSSADITLGHAGAVSLNLQGNIVGVVSGGACETVISDWHYNEQHSRAIHVDSRYILWQLQQEPTAKTLLAELNIAN
ncbi:S46 family peptidase [Rheinheimera sp. MMS21-TC3]|uniref:S46 family peptidase n=1 Tax=Rheinheimera sp. MMS21-TC3 TaxID=3072790 RepID=UPI0028C3C43B|nr:S46 family peptidase [Rheinheimera sp. MMS21-TC3]WNO61941.1 S46 family peptidase [Rheinheimera sp. MMS21-TC3]